MFDKGVLVWGGNKNLLGFDGPSRWSLMFDKGVLVLVYKLGTCWCSMRHVGE